MANFSKIKRRSHCHLAYVITGSLFYTGFSWLRLNFKMFVIKLGFFYYYFLLFVFVYPFLIHCKWVICNRKLMFYKRRVWVIKSIQRLIRANRKTAIIIVGHLKHKNFEKKIRKCSGFLDFFVWRFYWQNFLLMLAVVFSINVLIFVCDKVTRVLCLTSSQLLCLVSNVSNVEYPNSHT